MNRLVVLISCCIAASSAFAQVPFTEHRNGDLTIRIGKITTNHLKQLRKDIPGKQGRCVEIQVLELQDYGQKNGVMRIPADRPGIEFEPRADGRVMVTCGRFTEDTYSYDGKLESSLSYDVVEGY